MSERTEYSFRPTSNEMDEIWANRLDQDKLIENLAEWYKRDVTVANIHLSDIQGKSSKSEAAILFSKIAQTTNLELVAQSGLMEIVRPQTRKELEEHAKYVLSGEIAHTRYESYKKAEMHEQDDSGE